MSFLSLVNSGLQGHQLCFIQQYKMDKDACTYINGLLHAVSAFITGFPVLVFVVAILCLVRDADRQTDARVFEDQALLPALMPASISVPSQTAIG
jgi:hypothetical protein